VALTLTGAITVPAAVAAESAGTGVEAVADAAPASYERVELSSVVESWTAIRSGAPDNADGFGFQGARFVGQCVGEGGIGCAADDVQRIALDFGDLGSPDALADLQDGVIRSAYLTMDVVQDQQCGLQSISVYPASAVTKASTWNSSSMYTWLGAPLAAAPCGGPQEVRVDVTRLLNFIIRDDRPMAFGLKSAHEDCRGCGRASLGAEATLDVTLDMTETVSEPWTYSSVTPCATGEGRPVIPSLTPSLSVLLSNEREPFPSQMAALFTVRDLTTGDEIQRVETSPRGSGSRHSVQVGSGLLAHAGTYSWSAHAILPSGSLTEAVTCEFAVDVEAPGVPTITPVEGYPAVYENGTVAGGPFVPGAFALTGDGDVASFRYEFSPGLRGEIAPGEVLEFLPEESRGTRLTVRAVDGAGNVTSAEPYEFNVGFPATAGRWLFNEGAGATAAGELEGPVLRLSAGDLWGPGALSDFDPADAATSAEPIADPTGIVTMSAVVNPVNTAPGRVVSQGGDLELAVVTAPECPTASGTCWAFTVATGSGAERTTVYADAEPVPGAWNTVTAIRNPYVGDVRMYFCRSDELARPLQVAQADVEPLDVASEAPLVIGTSDWTGTVDNVRVLSGVPDEDKLSRWCFGSTGP
jgi:hypothetical protein